MRERALGVWRRLPHPMRWVLVAIAGFTCLVVGAVLLVLPGPGIPVLILGVVILASEFAWAQVVLDRVKGHSAKAMSHIQSTVRRRFPS